MNNEKLTITPAALSISQTIGITGIGRTKLYELINSGQLKARKLGRKTFVLREDLEDFLDSLQHYKEQ